MSAFNSGVSANWAGGYATAAGMLATVVSTLEDVEAQLSAFVRAKFSAGESVDRTGIYAHMTSAAMELKGHASFQGRIGEHSDEADSWSKALRQEKAVFADPAYASQMRS